MSLAGELLDTAKYLLRQNNNRPTDAAIRRSISMAYYALFHLLIEDAVIHLVPETGQQTSLARSFDHGKMKQVCKAIGEGRHPFLGSTVPDALKQLTATFVDLQDQRHDADYNRTRFFTKADARESVSRVEKALRLWSAVREGPIASPFFLLLLLGEPKAR